MSGDEKATIFIVNVRGGDAHRMLVLRHLLLVQLLLQLMVRLHLMLLHRVVLHWVVLHLVMLLQLVVLLHLMVLLQRLLLHLLLLLQLSSGDGGIHGTSVVLTIILVVAHDRRVGEVMAICQGNGGGGGVIHLWISLLVVRLGRG